MHNIDDINSILNAVNAINLKSKKRRINPDPVQNFIPKLNQDLKISPDLDRLILEAEQYINKSTPKLPQIDLVQNKNDLIKKKNSYNTHKDVQALIIEDLYSKFSKKVKKNTLKIIFNLHLKIKDLENKLENFQSKKNKNIDSLQIKKKNNSSVNLDKKDILRKEVVNSLLIQDSSIDLLNKKILNFKKTEEDLRFKIIDLDQDKILLLNKVKRFDELKDYKNKLINTRSKLQSIYKQVEKQKKIFINLKKYLVKIEQDSIFFKENYERLVVENAEVKKKQKD